MTLPLIMISKDYYHSRARGTYYVAVEDQLMSPRIAHGHALGAYLKFSCVDWHTNHLMELGAY